MRMADFWLTEKDLIPKLFQVLAPRYQGQNGGYTRMLQIPNPNQQDRAKMAVIEYKVNCLLPIARRDSNLTLLNQLLQGLRAAEPGSKHPQLPPSSNTRSLTEAKGHVAPISAHDHRPWELY
uniref:Large ribosomal subunit protein bL17m n=1 Tax=Bos taurus TaxID=9913 RepID=A0ABI0NPG3_BOVIN